MHKIKLFVMDTNHERNCHETNYADYHCVKSVRIRGYSGPYFPSFGLNTDQNNPKYVHFLRSVRIQ